MFIENFITHNNDPERVEYKENRIYPCQNVRIDFSSRVVVDLTPSGSLDYHALFYKYIIPSG